MRKWGKWENSDEIYQSRYLIYNQINKGRVIPYSWIRSPSSSKLGLWTQWNPNKNSSKLFECLQTDSKVYTDKQKAQNSQHKVGGLTLSAFKTYYESIIVKTMWYLLRE
jgi:hypothetical protein